MGDSDGWLERLPRPGAGGAGAGGKRVIKKAAERVGGKNPFAKYKAPGTASESSDDDGLDDLLKLKPKVGPLSPPPIPKRPGSSSSNARPAQEQWVERISPPGGSKGPKVPLGGGRDELLKARAQKQQQKQKQPAVAASSGSESEGNGGGGGGKKRGRLRRQREEESDEEGNVLVSPPARAAKKGKGSKEKKEAQEGEVLMIDLDSPNPVDAAGSHSKRAKVDAGAPPPSSSSASGPAAIEVVDDDGSSTSEAVGSAAGAGMAVVGSEEGEEEEEDGYEDEERAARARAKGMLRACELISGKIKAEVASWGAEQKRHAEDRLDLTTMAAPPPSQQGGGKTVFVRADVLARACPGVELKAYQITGLNWLFLLHQLDLDDIPRSLLPGGGRKGGKGKKGGGGEEPLRMNGVLADDMGLGKTCQTIAFLAYLRELEPDTHTHLIVVPASVLSNWEQEFARFAPNLEVWVYHGGAKERKALRLEYEEASCRFREHTVDVVLATYSYWEKEACADDRRFLDKLPVTYIVLDEGHSVKNTASGRFARLRRQRARRRLLLTGTPVQNHVKEMLALLAFLNPRIVDLGEENSPDRLWELLLPPGGGNGNGNGNGGSGAGEQAAMARLKRIFAPFVLRRLKTDVLDQLTRKETRVETVPLTEPQRHAYDAVTRRHLRAVQEAASRRTAAELVAEEAVVLPSPEEGEGDGKGKGKGRPRVLRSAVAAGAWAGGGAGAAGAALTAAPVSDKEAGHIFTEWRKAASHPLLLRRRFSGAQLGHMASVLHRTGYYGWDCSLDMVRKELGSLCDFELHSVAREVPQLESMTLPQEALFDAAKCRRLRELLPALIGGGHRVLLFSAWTRVLDILQQLFDEVLQLPYLRLDGSTAVTERQTLIDRFNAPDSAFPVFLLSTRAGGMGVNLTSADTVILYDTDWNPAVNDQAVDRCHRIGQTKPVTVYVLVAADTVDETIYKRAVGKKEKSESLLDKGDGEEAAALDGRRDAGGSSEISRIVQAELQLYLEHRKNLPTPESEDEENGEDGENGEEMVVVDDDGVASSAKKGSAASSSSSRRESTGSTGSRKRHSYSILESIVDSEDSADEEED